MQIVHQMENFSYFKSFNIYQAMRLDRDDNLNISLIVSYSKNKICLGNSVTAIDSYDNRNEIDTVPCFGDATAAIKKITI